MSRTDELYDPITKTDTSVALLEAIASTLRASDKPWAINRDKVLAVTRVNLWNSIEPVVVAAVRRAEERGRQREQARGLQAIADARAAGYNEGYAAALSGAATMLKRHGHRSAVTRLLALADEELKTPARPQPVNASPAGGPGRTAPESGAVAPEPTGPENGAQRGVQGLYVHSAQQWEDGGGRG